VGVLVVVTVALVQLFGSRPPASSSGGIPLGRVAPSIALSSTAGGSLSLDGLRGSKVVVYFYEGAG